MKALVYIFLIVFNLGIQVKSKTNFFTTPIQSELAQKNPILLGELEVNQIENFDWYKKNYTSYSPKEATTKQIKQLADNQKLSIEIYFGTWCPDSQYEVPRLLKLLHLVDFDMNNVKIIGLGRDKKVPNVSEEVAKKLDIQMIPTFIFYDSDEEINRFVEYAVESLEEDMLAILAHKDYKHSYKF